MNIISLNCPNCGKPIDLDIDKLQSYCGSCGSKLMLDIDKLQSLLIQREKERTYQFMIKENAERDKAIEKMRSEEREHIRISEKKEETSKSIMALVGGIALAAVCIILGIIGLIIVGS